MLLIHRKNKTKTPCLLTPPSLPAQSEQSESAANNNAREGQQMTEFTFSEQDQSSAVLNTMRRWAELYNANLEPLEPSPSLSLRVDRYTLTDTDIENKYVNLSVRPQDISSVRAYVVGMGPAEAGVHYRIDPEQCRITWDGLAWADSLSAGDVLMVPYCVEQTTNNIDDDNANVNPELLEAANSSVTFTEPVSPGTPISIEYTFGNDNATKDEQPAGDTESTDTKTKRTLVAITPSLTLKVAIGLFVYLLAILTVHKQQLLPRFIVDISLIASSLGSLLFLHITAIRFSKVLLKGVLKPVSYVYMLLLFVLAAFISTCKFDCLFAVNVGIAVLLMAMAAVGWENY